MIEVIVAKEVEIDLCQYVDAGILNIAIAEDEDGSIYNKETDNHRAGVTVVAEQGEERHDAIAEGDTLHDGPNAQMTKAEQVAFDGVVEPVDEESDNEKQYRALHDATDDLGRGLELGLDQREVARDAHDEEEEGEDEVAGRQTIPLAMAEHLIRLTPAIVDEDHAGDSNTTEDIET